MINKTSFKIPPCPHGVLENRHYLPNKMGLKLVSGDSTKGALVATELGAMWHQKNNSIIIENQVKINALAETISKYGWWLTAPTPISKTTSHNLLEQISLEVGANLIGTFLGLVIGAVAATEALNKIQNQNNLQPKSTNAKKKIVSRVAGRSRGINR